ncbi:histidine-rich glycoprotein-like [Trichogramma pretiosum]|uniref:histidine-rich glycoprotein-like n=1 Tax=Trichogramma pretiosum TaxID=7493 RepID=UPI0006C9576D|nr:histidine-rich glycoprotein-like [Trichogramma pretiosum]
MQCLSVLFLALIGCVVVCTYADQLPEQQQTQLTLNEEDGDEPHARSKRTLLLKKKLIAGAGILGLGVGLAKGYKYGYHSGPKVHRIYLSPPPIHRHVEYIEGPIYKPKIIEEPVFHHELHHDHHLHSLDHHSLDHHSFDHHLDFEPSFPDTHSHVHHGFV